MRWAIDQVEPVIQWMNIDIGVWQVGCKLANNLLEYVFDGDNHLNVSVLIDHQSHALAMFLEIEQLGMQGSAFGNEVRLFQQINQ